MPVLALGDVFNGESIAVIELSDRHWLSVYIVPVGLVDPDVHANDTLDTHLVLTAADIRIERHTSDLLLGSLDLPRHWYSLLLMLLM